MSSPGARQGLHRRCFAVLTSLLLLGCMVMEPLGIRLKPVDERAHGHPAALRFTPEHVPYAARDVVFSHAVEAHAALPCDLCHFGTASEETTGIPAPVSAYDRPRPEGDPARVAARAAVALPSMARCFTCHDGASARNDCIVCHLTNRKDRKPGFHDGLWPRRHKDMADEEDYKCALFHTQNDCRACHAERKPLSHTPRFERSTHGRLATHDRRACAVCHDTSFCENCHSQPPPDHTAAFTRGGGHRQAALIRGRSCIVCHRFEDACAECHGD